MGLFGSIGKIAKGLVGSIPVVGGIASGVMDAVSGMKGDKRADQNAATNNAATKAQIELARKRLEQDQSQFGDTMGLNRDKLAQDDQQFNQQFGLNQQKFGKEQETEQFGRARNTRFAKVRAPFVTGLLGGKNLAEDPAAQQRLAKIGM